MDLEVGLPEAINLIVEDWSHVQELDYEQLPFKCRHCHGYGHFSRSCKKKLSKRRENNGHKFKKQVQQSKEINQRNNEEKWGRVVIPPDRNIMELEQL